MIKVTGQYARLSRGTISAKNRQGEWAPKYTIRRRNKSCPFCYLVVCQTIRQAGGVIAKAIALGEYWEVES